MIDFTYAKEMTKEDIGKVIENNVFEHYKCIFVARQISNLNMAGVYKLVKLDRGFAWVDLIYSRGIDPSDYGKNLLKLGNKYYSKTIEDAILEASKLRFIQEIVMLNDSREFFTYLGNIGDGYHSKSLVNEE